MIRLPFILLVCTALFSAGSAVRAVYAPIPEVEQGRLLTVYLGAAYYYDTNIFGAADNAVESMVVEAQPTIVANVSVGDQTFLMASYQLTLDYFDNRPGEQWLESHSISGRLSHTFTPRLEMELSDSFQIVKNPESLLPGVGGGAVNPDQSYDFNQFEGKLAYNINQRTGLSGKVRAVNFAYDNRHLSNDLDHGEYTVGLEAVRMARENLQLSAEYRYKAVRYDHGGTFKDKDSHCVFAGINYSRTKHTGITARLGAEVLLRRGGDDAVLPYAEFAVKHDYRASSFVSAGYSFSPEEPSNANLYSDMYVHQFFANVQHALSKVFWVSMAVNWQPSRINARRGVTHDIDESYLKSGAAITYEIARKWSVSLTYDYDFVSSDDPGRDLDRMRAGMHFRWVF